MIRNAALCGFTLVLNSCGDPLFVGSDLLWTARHEGNDLSEWTEDDLGGFDPEANLGITSEQARSGARALRLTLDTQPDEAPEVCIRRTLRAASEAYYSAFFYIPEPVVTDAIWTIMKFRLHPAEEPELTREGLDLNLRSLRDGRLIVFPFDHDSNYLQPPVADPTPLVPVARWFQLEVFYRSSNDGPGEATVWVDGRRLYDLPNWPTSFDGPEFTICNIGEALSPSSATLLVDDVAISRTRVGPGGVFSR